MAKTVKCKNCGEECCSCTGCQPSKYKDGLCPSCQKKEKQNVNISNNNGMPGLHIIERDDREN